LLHKDYCNNAHDITSERLGKQKLTRMFDIVERKIIGTILVEEVVDRFQ
jgi:hypothetical protein